MEEQNPFGNMLPAVTQQENALVDVEQQRAIAEVQSAMIIAKRFPRDQKAAMDRILTACTRPTLAEKAVYSFSKGGTDISGPSIRLGEAIAQNWGNIQFGIRELSQSNGESTVESYAWDIESNTRQVKTFQVPHVRYSRAKGNVKLTDPREIYELIANQGARRLRTCILGIVPGDVVDAAVKQCEATLATSVQITPELIQSLMDKFSKFGVTKVMIEARIQRRIDAITPALVVQLGKIYNSLHDGMSFTSDWFQQDPSEQPKDLKAKLKAKTEKPEPAKPEEPKPNILCPIQKKGVFPAECIECEERQKNGCDAYTEWEFEEGQK